MTRLMREDRGVALVEFALVTPVLILVLVACLDFARAINAYVTVASASREGARYATVHPAADGAAVQAYLATRVAPLDPLGLTVTLVYTPTADERWTATAPAPGTVRVDVAYQWTAASWVVGPFFATASGSPTFTATSSMETIR
jgi:Flp pilus assembly protein TadG